MAFLTYRGNMFCGGQGIYTAYVSKALRRLGCEVHVISGPPYPELENGIPLHKIHNSNIFGQPLRKWARKHNPMKLLTPINIWETGVSRLGVFPEMQSFGLRLLLRWNELHRNNPFDLIFDNQSVCWGLLGLQATGIPVISLIHHPLHIDRLADFRTDHRLTHRIKRTLYFPLLMQQWIAPRLNRIITVSNASRTAIEHYFGIPSNRINVVHNGTDTEIFQPTPNTKKQTDLIFVGRTEDRKKGIGTLIEALRKLPEVTLKIVDGRIGEQGLVPHLLKKHGVSNRVVLNRKMLTTEELVQEYSTARIAVVPSLFEGFGFPASEAMACGIPVIANAAGALPEVVGQHGHTGWLVSPNDPDALAHTVRSVLEDSTRLLQVGRRARDRIEQNFCWEHTARSLLSIFEETIRASYRRPQST